jgi:CheY-like chemotaxis protein
MQKTILLADDSITIQKIVNLTFSGEGIDVVTVGNGDAALKKIHEIRPHLVLADIFMPGKNGYEVCEYLKNEPELQSTPVILLVGAFEPFDANEAGRVKADGHLTKPFEIKVLISAVNSLMNAAEEQSAAPEPAATEASAQTVEETARSADTEESVSSPSTPEVPAGEPRIQAEDSTDSSERAPALGEPVHAIPAQAVTDQAEELQPETPVASAAPMVPDSGVASAPVQNFASSAGVSASLTIEDSDPLGLMSDDLGVVAAVSEAEVSPDSRSLVVDIWETKQSPAAESQRTQSITSVPETAREALVAGLRDSESERVRQAAASVPPAASGQPVIDPEELIERITNRVVERLSRDAIERIAWEVVPDLADLMIKEHVETHFRASQQP